MNFVILDSKRIDNAYKKCFWHKIICWRKLLLWCSFHLTIISFCFVFACCIFYDNDHLCKTFVIWYFCCGRGILIQRLYYKEDYKLLWMWDCVRSVPMVAVDILLMKRILFFYSTVTLFDEQHVPNCRGANSNVSFYNWLLLFLTIFDFIIKILHYYVLLIYI